MTDEKEIRQVMAAGLVEAAKNDDRIVVLETPASWRKPTAAPICPSRI